MSHHPRVRLHQLIYAAGALAALHFIWRVKLDLSQPLTYALILALLLLLVSSSGSGSATHKLPILTFDSRLATRVEGTEVIRGWLTGLGLRLLVRASRLSR